MRRAPAPQPSYRLIPSCFPPIGLFDTVATAADLEAVMELAGWTNDRLVEERLYRLARTEWVFGRTNSSIVMASFLHVAPGGMRFNGSELGAWYSAAKLTTAIIEVAHHMRREAVATGIARLARTFRTYTARLEGSFVDISGEKETMADIYDHTSYAASQRFGEEMRATGETGILFDSPRHEGGINPVAFRPSRILEVTQADHYEITVEASSRRIEARKHFLPELGKLETNQAAALAGLALMTKQSGKWRDQAFIASGHANIRRSLQLRDSGSCGQSPEAT
ncbi:hypothetical protein C038_03179 [Brucella sp. 63/311]|nr:hypothetical protein C038_03179 [Brucella sp. 63/311]